LRPEPATIRVRSASKALFFIEATVFRTFTWLLLALLTLGTAACSSDREKGLNRDKDRPRTTDKTGN
jgi:hypothetical protein